MVTTHRSAMLDLATAYLMQALESEMMLDRDSAGTYLMISPGRSCQK